MTTNMIFHIFVAAATCLFTISPVESVDATVHYDVLEERSAGSYIGSVALDSKLFTDTSNEMFQQLQFQITSDSKYAHLFSMETNTSLLFTKKVIDREDFLHCFATCILKFNVAVYDTGLGTEPKFIEIVINILDFNDHAPSFQETEQTIDVSESAGVDSVIANGAALDLDQSKENSINTYEMSPSFTEFELELVNSGQEYVIRLKTHLDRETKERYEFLILAVDGGEVPLTGMLSVTIIVTDANDNFPAFTEPRYTAVISENVALKSSILSVSASDRDDGDNGRVSYQYSSRVSDTIVSMFNIDASSGELTAAGQIDFENNNVFDFQIIAVDHGVPQRSSTASVVITVTDENDNAPQININQPPGGTVLSENVQVNSFVTHVEIIDVDSGKNGEVTCDVLDHHFRLEHISNFNFKLVVNLSVDHDVQPVHNVTILCKDLGDTPRSSTASLLVYIEDVNDNAPQFSQSDYKLTLTESNVADISILAIAATDKDSGKNGQISYSLQSGTESLFTINSGTGIITAVTSLDRDTLGDQVTFSVFAADFGNPAKTSTCLVNITLLDLNDNAPAFTSNPIRLEVVENSPAGTIIGNITVNDPDKGPNGTVTLKFPTDEVFTNRFSVVNNILKTVATLDREDVSFHQFSVVAMDMGGRTSSVIVIIYVTDINDNPPEILYPTNFDSTKYVPVSLTPGSEVLEVKARDNDSGMNAELLYSIMKDNSSGLFALDAHSGQLNLNKTLHDYNIKNVFVLTISIVDGGQPALNTSTTFKIEILHGYISSPTVSAAGISSNLWIVIAIVIVTVILSIIMIIVMIKICWFNRRKSDGPMSSVFKNDCKQLDPQLIDSGSSSSSTSSRDSNGNERLKIQDGVLQTGYLETKEDTGSLLNTTLSSVDKNNEHLYMERVKQLEYEMGKKLDETTSDNSGELGTRDSGQGGSETNSLTELPGLDLPDFTNNPALTSDSDYFGNSGQQNNMINNHHGNSVQDPPDLIARSNSKSSDNVFITNSPAKFTHVPSRTAERKELSKVKKPPKRVMFSDDLENSQSSGRSSVSYSDITRMVESAGLPRRFNRLCSVDSAKSSDHLVRSNNNVLRRSVDNLDWQKRTNLLNKPLPSNKNNVFKEEVNSAQNQPSDRVFNELGKSSSQTQSRDPVFTLPGTYPRNAGYHGNNFNSGSYSLNLATQYESDDVFPSDLYV